MNTASTSSGFWSGKRTGISPSSAAIRILPAEEAEKPKTLNSLVQNGIEDVAEFFRWARRNVKIQPAKKRLRVCESVSLGEKRFIAVVQLDGREFLLGGSPNSLSLLASVGNNTATFANVLNESYEQDRK